MPIYLVQHGKNNPKDQDPEQHLSSQGRADTQRVAEAASRAGAPVHLIHHSPKTRAKETAELLSSWLKPAEGIREREGIKALDDVTSLTPELNPGDNVMLVGHLPFMERLCTYLVTGYQEPAILKFQNSGIVCLDKDEESGNWQILWTLMPSVI